MCLYTYVCECVSVYEKNPRIQSVKRTLKEGLRL